MIDTSTPDFTDTPAAASRPDVGYSPADPNVPPGVTIATPYFDTGPVFHETARSIYRQTFQQWEWVIIDDGSTEPESQSMLATFAARDVRIRVIHHDGNRGLSAARNSGFAAARAPYVVQLDSDDLLEPTAIEEWLWFLEAHPEFAFVKGFTVGFGAEEYLWTRGFHEGRGFLSENLVAATSMIRASVHRGVGGYDESIRGGLEDWDFWLRCANAGYWGATVPRFLDWYRRRPRRDARWSNWDHGAGQREFHAGLRRRYPHLWNGGFPAPAPAQREAALPEEVRWPNRLNKPRPRLLLLVPQLAVGGADKFNLDVVRQLTGRGWDVTIVSTVPGDYTWLPLFTRATPDVLVLPDFLPIADHPRFLRYVIASRQPDLILIANSEIAYRLLPYLRAHAPSIPVVDYCHLEEEHWNNGGYARMAVEYQPLLDLNIVASAHLKRWMEARGAAPDRVRVCHINVDTGFWQPDREVRARVRRALGLDETTPLLLYCGRLCEQKQPRVFAGTMQLLARRGCDFRAVVAGDGPDEPWLRDAVRRAGLRDRVRLLGAVPNDQVRDLLRAADVLFLPSRWEGIALSIYEAMACGLPVVGADVGGQRELVTPECGVLLPPSDAGAEAEAYAAALAALLADPAERVRLGANARRRVETTFPLEQMIEQLLSLFDEARRLQRDWPRPSPVPAVARLTALQAVEHFRLASDYDKLRQRENDRRRREESWRTRTYFGVQRLLMPWYQRALARDARWLVPLKETLKRAFLRNA